MKRDETIEYYQKRAGEYDKVYTRDNPGRQEELADLYASSRTVLKGRKALDLACGTGYWTSLVSETAADITGIDINPGTLKEASKKNYGCPLSLVRADFFALPFVDHVFDGLLATYVISHVRRQEIAGFWEEVRRLCRPGTAAFICDNNPICELQPELIWDSDRINTYKKRRLENGQEYRILKNYFEETELREILGKAGELGFLEVNSYYWSAMVIM